MVDKNSGFQRFLRRNFGTNRSDRTFHTINYILAFIFGFVMIYPFIYVLIKSLTVYEVVNGTPREIFSFAAYKRIINDQQIIRSLLTTFTLILIKEVTVFFVTFLMAYALSKKYLKGRKILSMMLLITMYVSGGIISTYILITRTLNWKNNYLTYIIPSCVGAYNVFVVKAFLQRIPDSLEEAALIDGANSLQILFRVYVPLSGPIIATIGLWEGVALWNDWSTGLYYFTDTSKQVFISYLRGVMTGMSTTISGDNVDESIMAMGDNIKMAIIVVGVVPILLVYPFIQKHFVKGMLVGSVKG